MTERGWFAAFYEDLLAGVSRSGWQADRGGQPASARSRALARESAAASADDAERASAAGPEPARLADEQCSAAAGGPALAASPAAHAGNTGQAACAAGEDAGPAGGCARGCPACRMAELVLSRLPRPV